MRRRYVPDRGDAVWLSFDSRSGHEQSGRRPAVVLSPRSYNSRAGLALVCPITSRMKNYPFEVALGEDLPIGGAVLADQLQSADWAARRATRICTLPGAVMDDILGKLQALLR